MGEVKPSPGVCWLDRKILRRELHGEGSGHWRVFLSSERPEGIGEVVPRPSYWVQEAGPTVFEPFMEKTEYFGEPKYAWMLNFRVRSLAAMVEQLRAAGIAVEVDETEYPNGVFARLQDPERNPVAIWQPRGNEVTLPRAADEDRD